MSNKYRVVKWKDSDKFYFVQTVVFKFDKKLEQHVWDWVTLEVFTNQDLAEEYCRCKYFEDRDGEFETVYETC